jgi:3-oxoacyl-[acyl-carrier protein] reductase
MNDAGQRVALVSGASRGIGRAIALELGRQGGCVIGTATSEAGATAIDAALGEAGVRGRGLVMDVTDPGSIERAIAAIAAEFGAVTVLVNNAGITRDGLLMRMSEDDWSAVIDTNLGSVFRLSKACVRGMFKARWGRIINIASVVGVMGNAGQANYAAAKAGMMGLTRSLAREFASRRVTVNCVAPGFIETDMTRALSAEQRAAMLGTIPLGEFGEPEQIAAVVGFLASDGGSYITGETVQVNGGMYMQ